MTKLPTLRARHSREERALIRQALRESGWLLPGAAELLGVSKATLQSIVRRDPELAEERDRKRPKEGQLSGGAT